MATNPKARVRLSPKPIIPALPERERVATGKRGVQPLVFTSEERALVVSLVAVGSTHEQIAKVLKISADTLVRHFKDELDTGTAQANAQVVRHLFALTKTNVAAAIFWLKNRASDKWSNDDNSGNINVNISLSQMVMASLKPPGGTNGKTAPTIEHDKHANGAAIRNGSERNGRG